MKYSLAQIHLTQGYTTYLRQWGEAYYDQLKTILNSSDVDHTKLEQGQNSTYQNISSQLDKLNNTNQYTELYNEDVKQNK